MDTTVDLTAASVFVQLKCTSSPTATHKGDYRIPLKQHWVDSWSVKMVPVYVMLVVVPPLQDEWIEQVSEQTLHRTHAYWERFDVTAHTKSIVVPKSQRFQASTLAAWETQLNDVFSGGAP